MKSVCIWSYSGPHFPAFGLNRERYGVCECGKIWTRITRNTGTFYLVWVEKTLKDVAEKESRFVLRYDNLTAQTNDDFKTAVSNLGGICGNR